MTTKPTMTAFVVLMSRGDYDNFDVVPQAIFVESPDFPTPRRDADTLATRLNREIAEIRGIERSIQTLLEEWTENNPRPAWDAPDADRQAWNDAECAELVSIRRRLKIAEAWKEVGCEDYGIERAYFFVKEVPLNIETYGNLKIIAR